MIKPQSLVTWAISIVFALFAISLVIQLVDDAGTPILLDPEHKLEIPPPPKSMYQMGKESNTQSSPSSHSTDSPNRPK